MACTTSFPALLSFLPVLLGLLATFSGGVALGAWGASATRPLLRDVPLPMAAGIGAVVGLGAVIHTKILVFGSTFLNWGNLPVGLLALAFLFGTVIALVTLSWEGTALVGGFLSSYFLFTALGLGVLFGLVRWLSVLPPFLQVFFRALLGGVSFAVAALVQVFLLALLGFVAALVARLVNQYLVSTPETTTNA
jgi:hypothetical protein